MKLQFLFPTFEYLHKICFHNVFHFTKFHKMQPLGAIQMGKNEIYIGYENALHNKVPF